MLQNITEDSQPQREEVTNCAIPKNIFIFCSFALEFHTEFSGNAKTLQNL